MTEPPQKLSTRKESVTFRPSHTGYKYIEDLRQELGVERTALINAMLQVATRHPTEIRSLLRKAALLEKRQEKK